MKIRLTGIYHTNTVFLNGVKLDPKSSFKLVNHSPDGFAWGYSGSGPAQLALAILLKLTAKKKALANYQHFKREIISGIPKCNFILRDLDVSKYV